MNTSKKAVRLIAEVCLKKGIRKIVFSPGSRSAPLVIAFNRIREMECLVIPDERVAGYFALGMAQQLKEPVAVVCTSGTAVANLLPAVCEAYYQKIPLLILTADRPLGAVEKGENQAIEQENIFGGFVLTCAVNGDSERKEELEKIGSAVADTIHRTQKPYFNIGHINIRLSEPLYNVIDEKTERIEVPSVKFRESFHMKLRDKRRIKQMFKKSVKKMFIVGSRKTKSDLLKTLTKLNERTDIIIIHENLSNLTSNKFVNNADACITALDETTSQNFIPDLVVTLGNQIVSRKILQFLKDKPKIHWDIPVHEEIVVGRKMFGEVFDKIDPINEKEFLEIIKDVPEKNTSSYKANWLALSKAVRKRSEKYFFKLPFSDLKVFKTLVESFPIDSNIQYGNSTPIRYSNLFQHKKSQTVNANRGTSGIDGCLSTAAGAAYANTQMTICVVGDISFFYDSNALWNNYLSPHFRIIIINNGGGNIFRLVEGASSVNDFEKLFEAKHNLSAKYIASMYDLPYYFCDSQKGLNKILKTFHRPSLKPKILEIKTDGILSAEVYKNYFKFLKNNYNNG